MIYSSQGDIFTVRIDGTDRKKLVNTKFGGAEFQVVAERKDCQIQRI